jgi:GNAT superfamily N-acetyltransferase
MIATLNLLDAGLALALQQLQRRAYRVEAELIGFDGIPPLHESLEALQACGETFYGFFADGALAGAIALEREGTTVTISRLVVDPGRFRRGIGGQLLRFVLENEKAAGLICVSTGSLNTPALQLYRCHRFRERGQRQVAPGVFVTHLELAQGDNGSM